MPKNTDEEKAARKEAMQKALKEATLVPYSIMELCLESLKVTEMGLGCTNTNAASDLGVASLNLKSAVQGAWLNVLINLGGIRDEAFVNEYKAKGEAILAEALPLADKIYWQACNLFSIRAKHLSAVAERCFFMLFSPNGFLCSKHFPTFFLICIFMQTYTPFSRLFPDSG